MPKKKSKEEEKAPAVDAANEGESTEEEEQEAAAAEPEPDEDLLGRKKKQQPVNDGTFTFSSDPLLNEIQKKIVSVFEIFDVGGQKAVDVREVGTMCRALDLYPTEADVHEIIGHVEEMSTKGIVKMNTFITHITKVIAEGKYKAVPMEILSRAYRNLDKDKTGLIDPEKLKEMLMREGEPMMPDEIEEMMSFAVNKEDGLIHWEDYVDKLYRSFLRK